MTWAPDSERRVLPRWRLSTQAVQSGELRSEPSTKEAVTEPRNEREYQEALKEWGREPSIETAMDLVPAALVLGHHKEAEDAARLLVTQRGQVRPALRDLAHSLIAIATGKPSQSVAEPPDRGALRGEVNRLRKRLREYPRNAILWIDLAYAHTALGHKGPARRAVLAALDLAGESRLVLRSAARYFVHANEPNTATEILRRSALLKTDPWVMAAEIAISGVAGIAPAAYRRALALTEADRIDPWHSAELYSALGTLQLLDGSSRKVRRLFLKSLRKPTGNAVAQAQWAATAHNVLSVPGGLLQTDLNFEATALRGRAERRWEDAVNACRQWSAMEPTSTRPLVLGCFIAEAALQDGHRALEFTRQLLVLSPKDDMALNNHAVALAYAGQLAAARETLSSVSRAEASERNRVVLEATEGLLLYREGAEAEGLKQYLDAAEHAMLMRDRELQSLVLWHLVREEARTGARGIGPIVDKLWKSSQPLNVPEISALHASVIQQIAVNDKKSKDGTGTISPETLLKVNRSLEWPETEK